MNCGEVHSQPRELVGQGYTATLVATTLAHQPVQPRGSANPDAPRAVRWCTKGLFRSSYKSLITCSVGFETSGMAPRGPKVTHALEPSEVEQLTEQLVALPDLTQFDVQITNPSSRPVSKSRRFRLTLDQLCARHLRQALYNPTFLPRDPR